MIGGAPFETIVQHPERGTWLFALLSLLSLCAPMIPCIAKAGQNRYRYSPYEKPDPFAPTIFLAAPKEAINPLQRQSLNSFVLVGTIIGKESSALLSGKGEGGVMTTFVIRIGDKIGERSGTVVSIFKDRIIVREPLDSSEQREFSRFQDTALVIRPYNSNATMGLTKDVSEDAKKERSDLTEALVQDVMPRDASKTTIYAPSATKKKDAHHAGPGHDGLHLSPSKSMEGQDGAYRQTPVNPESYSAQNPLGATTTAPGSNGGTAPGGSFTSQPQTTGTQSQGGITIQQSYPVPQFPPPPSAAQGDRPNVLP